MFESYLLKSIHFDESVIRIVRTSWIHYRLSLCCSTIVLIISFFLIYPLFVFGVIGVIIFILLLIVVFVSYIRVLIIWSLNVFIITNHRIIDVDQKKIFEKHVTECPLENIQDIQYSKKGILSTIFNVGTVIIQLERGKIEFTNVRKPEILKELIMNVQHRHNKKSNDLKIE